MRDLDHASMSTQETEQEVFPEEEEFKSLFLSQTFPSATQALLADKEATGFDFQQIRSDLKLNFYECIALINYIRTRVHEKRSLVDETQFSTEEELVNHVKESKEYTKLSKDMPFWSEEKYLMPFDPQDPLLYSFDEEGECEEEELDDSEREKMLEE